MALLAPSLPRPRPVSESQHSSTQRVNSAKHAVGQCFFAPYSAGALEPQRAPCGVAAASRRCSTAFVYSSALVEPGQDGAGTALAHRTLSVAPHAVTGWCQDRVRGTLNAYLYIYPCPVRWPLLPTSKALSSQLRTCCAPYGSQTVGESTLLPGSISVCSPLEGDAQVTLPSLCGDQQET